MKQIIEMSLTEESSIRDMLTAFAIYAQSERIATPKAIEAFTAQLYIDEPVTANLGAITVSKERVGDIVRYTCDIPERYASAFYGILARHAKETCSVIALFKALTKTLDTLVGGLYDDLKKLFGV